MNVCAKWCGRALAILLLPCFAGFPSQAQEQKGEHVVAVRELNQAAAQVGETRQADEAALRKIFSSDKAQEALRSAGIDYQRVDAAVSQINDEDLSRLAARARTAKLDFAAGRAGGLSDRDLLVIIIIAVLLIALIAILR
jgi:hypothetical protein